MFNYNKNRFLRLIIIVLSLLFNNVQSQQDRENQNMGAELPQTVSPSKGVVIAVLSIMFLITFLLLLYVKFCRVTPLHLLNQNPNFQGPTQQRSIFSGVDKQVIETLPFFKFSSLKGSREGLECTVCLSKFEDAEILRLLPKCKHAFHKNCIDTWLESHSTCPLCRYRVEEIDIKNFTYSLSSRFLRVPSNLSEDPNLEIFIQRGADSSSGGANSSSSSSVKKWKHVNMINHKIFISDVVTRRRWSDLNSSDLLSLNSEMLGDMYSSARFSPLDGISSVPSSSNNEEKEEEENSFTALNPGEKRSMSEIANVPRFVEIGKRNGMGECGDNGSEERLWRIWLPIARRTVQWFARQERNSVVLDNKPLASKV